MIEDLRVEKTELARSFKKIERTNTDLVGENMTLEKKICGKSFMPLCFLSLYNATFLSSNPLSLFLQCLKMICLLPRLTPRPRKLSSRGRLL